MTIWTFIFPILLACLAFGAMGLGIGVALRRRFHRKKRGVRSQKNNLHAEKRARRTNKSLDRQADKQIDRTNKKQKQKDKNNKTNDVSNSKNNGFIKVANSGAQAGYDVSSPSLRGKFIQTMEEYNNNKKSEPESISSVQLVYNKGSEQYKKDSLIGPDSVIMSEMLPYILSEEMKEAQYPLDIVINRHGKESIISCESKEQAVDIYNTLFPVVAPNTEIVKEQTR